MYLIAGAFRSVMVRSKWCSSVLYFIKSLKLETTSRLKSVSSASSYPSTISSVMGPTGYSSRSLLYASDRFVRLQFLLISLSRLSMTCGLTLDQLRSKSFR